MPCKSCGKPLNRHTRQLAHYGVVSEALCWGCKVWAQTGYIMPERRA